MLAPSSPILQLLKEIGMEFSPAWEDLYDKVNQYKEEHGNIEITATQDPHLAAWMQVSCLLPCSSGDADAV